MPLKPSRRAEACRLLAVAYEQAQAALLAGNSEDQFERWKAIAVAAAACNRAAIAAVHEAGETPKRGKQGKG